MKGSLWTKEMKIHLYTWSWLYCISLLRKKVYISSNTIQSYLFFPLRDFREILLINLILIFSNENWILMLSFSRFEFERHAAVNERVHTIWTISQCCIEIFTIFASIYHRYMLSFVGNVCCNCVYIWASSGSSEEKVSIFWYSIDWLLTDNEITVLPMLCDLNRLLYS